MENSHTRHLIWWMSHVVIYIIFGVYLSMNGLLLNIQILYTTDQGLLFLKIYIVCILVMISLMTCISGSIDPIRKKDLTKNDHLEISYNEAEWHEYILRNIAFRFFETIKLDSFIISSSMILPIFIYVVESEDKDVLTSIYILPFVYVVYLLGREVVILAKNIILCKRFVVVVGIDGVDINGSYYSFKKGQRLRSLRVIEGQAELMLITDCSYRSPSIEYSIRIPIPQSDSNKFINFLKGVVKANKR